MNIITTITNDIFIRTLTNITTSILSTHSLFVWFVDYKNNDYNIYKKEIKLTDLHNKLLIVSALIKDIIKKYHLKNDDNIDKIIQKFINDTTNEMTKDTTDNNFTLIDYEVKLNIFTEIPDCIKLALISTLEIITILNNEINKIHTKIQGHHKSWLSYIYSIKIHDEMDAILEHNIILDKRINLLFQILNAY
jgi:hypothetical protein